jgi:hypothetical protein
MNVHPRMQVQVHCDLRRRVAILARRETASVTFESES